MKAFDEIWEDIHATQEWGKYPSEPVIRFVARNYYSKKCSDIKILDFGCGAGAHTWYLAREGFDTYAFDGSKSAIERVKSRLKAESLCANLKVMDGIELDYQSEMFDAVIDNVCIYANTIENIKKMYREVYRVLKKNGKIFTTVFSRKTTGYGTGIEIEKDTYKNMTEGNLQGRGICHFYSSNELTDILSGAGFKNITVEPMEYVDRGNVVGMYIVQADK